MAMPQIAEIAAGAIAGADTEFVPGADDVPDVQTEFDIGRIGRDLGWRPRLLLAAGLKTIADAGGRSQPVHPCGAKGTADPGKHRSAWSADRGWARFGEQRGVDKAAITGLRAALDAVPGQISAAIEAHADEIRAIAESQAERSTYLFVGGGPAFASVFFGAAKLKECTPDHSIAIPIEEYHHHHSQKRGDPLFPIAPDGFSIPRGAIRRRRGKGSVQRLQRRVHREPRS
jgi:hypothetical protein